MQTSAAQCLEVIAVMSCKLEADGMALIAMAMMLYQMQVNAVLCLEVVAVMSCKLEADGRALAMAMAIRKVMRIPRAE